MRVKELLKHFPKDFMVDICTPVCRIGNTVEKILNDDFTKDILVSKWRVTDENVLQIDN